MRVLKVAMIFISWIIFITVLFLIKTPKAPQEINVPYLDKLVHSIFFMGAAFLMMHLLSLFNNNMKIINIITTITIVSLYGLVIEYIQPIFNRSCDMNDLVADIIGAVIGISIYYPLVYIYKNKIKPLMFH